MAEIALVVGTITPSTWLARGQWRIVPYTRHIKRMAKRGYITVLARQPIALSGGSDGG